MRTLATWRSPALSSLTGSSSAGPAPSPCPADLYGPDDLHVLGSRSGDGSVHQRGTVGGTPPSVPPVSDDTPANAFVPTPAIDIIKRVNGADANEAPGLEVQVGATVTWTYEVTNTGNVDLINVTVTDSKGVTVDCGGTNVIAMLLVGEQRICTGSGLATVGQYTNTGFVTGTPNPPLLPGQPPIPTPPVTDQDDANHFGTPIAIVVLPPPPIPPGELPPTGSNSNALLHLAAGLLLVGGGMLGLTTWLRRRRMSATPAA
jgi:hypothetical protein